MKKLVVAAALLSTPWVWAQAKPKLRPGNWRLIVTTEMPGAPVTPPPMTIERCITPEQASDPKQVARGDRSQDCDVKDWKQTGNKITWSVACHARGGTQTGTGEMIYEEDSYTGTATTVMDDPRMGHVKIVQHMNGRRTGDCVK